jgi:hypothetical protein
LITSLNSPIFSKPFTASSWVGRISSFQALSVPSTHTRKILPFLMMKFSVFLRVSTGAFLLSVSSSVHSLLGEERSFSSYVLSVFLFCALVQLFFSFIF